ncbi:hypothetical protein QTP70_005691 [Hemibagrus guttatus]|uniref:ribonuclease H n=1 Tax=Hemibagrus guttatus TaxID=175788 RepID=A0AAE0Q931_9TELE|nr:hypothetical protein QTP70_005691 [Hemibagrus guttatus]
MRTSKKWTSEAVGELQECLDCTDWDVFRSTTNSLDEYTDTVSSYIYFCEDSIIPTCTKVSYNNDKPWFTAKLRRLRSEKEAAFRSGDRGKYKEAKYIFSEVVRRAKTEHAPHLSNTPPPTPLTIKEEEVNRLFKRLNTRKATGPDSVSPSLLKHCANQLSPVFTDIFNTSLETCHVPACFKTSAIVPVPKKTKITGLNDYRPVARTSVVMKSFECLVLSYLKDITDPLLDPLQFAYRDNRSVDDAVNMSLHFILQHLDSPGSYARILFVDFSSAFNTIIPALLRDKLFQLNVPDSMSSWITDFLTDRRQFMRLGMHVSDLQHISTGSPQGCVLSPLLFSLYTNGCTSGHHSVKLLKFADDTTLIGLISDGDEMAYRGTTITKELKWEQNIRSLNKKAQQRMYFLRQLKKFLLPAKMLVNFYTAIIESILTSSITVWFAAATARDKAKLQRVIHSAEKVIGCSLPSLQELYVSRSRRRAAKITADPSHPGNELFQSLPSGKRLRMFIPDYAVLAAPLSAIAHGQGLQAHSKVTWTEIANAAFKRLKQTLQMTPTLGIPDPMRPFTDGRRRRWAQRMDPASSGSGGAPLQNTSPSMDPAELRQIIVHQDSLIRTFQAQLEAPTIQLSSATTAAPQEMPIAHGELPRLALPEKFDGSADRCRGFLRQCEVFFSHQPGMYREDGTKCAFLLSLLTGKALKWASAVWDADPLIRVSYSHFEEGIHEVFEHQQVVKTFQSN